MCKKQKKKSSVSYKIFMLKNFYARLLGIYVNEPIRNNIIVVAMFFFFFSFLLSKTPFSLFFLHFTPNSQKKKRKKNKFFLTTKDNLSPEENRMT